MKRTFLAVKIFPEPALINVLEDFYSSLNKEKIKWVEKNNLHITLKFLGDTEEENIPVINEKLLEVASKDNNFHIILQGCGVFKNLRKPKVLWVGLHETENLKNLHLDIENSLAETGFAKEERPFSPHLTIGRIKFLKNYSILRSKLGQYHDKYFQQNHVNEFIFYESILTQAGPIYRIINKFPLKV